MCMQKIRVDTARRAYETGEQRRDEQRPPGPTPQVPDHAVAVRDSVVPVLLRPDDLDVDTARAKVLHRVREEPSRDVTRMTWV